LPFTFDRDSVATRVNKQGLIETVGADQPRIDYLNDSNGALKLEPSRTNLITYSEDFSQSAWIKSNTSITSNVEISPDGTLNGSKIVGSGYLQFLINAVASNVYTFSVFWKKDTSSVIKFRISSSGQDETITLNTETLSFSNITNIDDYSVEEFGNGWYRLKITWTEQNTEVAGIRIICDESDATSSLYIYGAQVEEGSYATSYIPTQGSAVTRVADDMPNNLNINPLNIGNSYTLFLDADLNNFENNRVFCEIENSASNGVFTIRNTIGQIRVYNNLDAQYPTGNLQSNTNRWAIRIDGNSYKIFGADNSLSGTLPTARNIGEIKFYGSLTELKINNFNIYNTALSDAECEALVN
jgi:hypothetical protein